MLMFRFVIKKLKIISIISFTLIQMLIKIKYKNKLSNSLLTFYMKN